MLDVVADDADSAVDTDAFEDLVDSTDDVEVADLARDDMACSRSAERLSPEQLEASGIDELGHPEETGFFVHGDEGDTRSVLQFERRRCGRGRRRRPARSSSPTAPRRSPASRTPSSASWEIETDGEQVRIDIDYDDPEDVSAVISRGDYLSVCPPE